MTSALTGPTSSSAAEKRLNELLGRRSPTVGPGIGFDLITFGGASEPVEVVAPAALVGISPFYDGAVLKIRGRFASSQLAQHVRSLVMDGVLSTMSVGMPGVERVKDSTGVTHITRAELLEVSFVSIPSNREARVLTTRSLRRGPSEAEYGRAVAKAQQARVKALLMLAELDLAEVDRSEAERARKAMDPMVVLRDARCLLSNLERGR